MRRKILLAAILAMMAAPALASEVSIRMEGGENCLANARAAAGYLADVRVGSGETFSFAEATRCHSASDGYIEAENGFGEIAVGGGAGQAASALYLALEQTEDIAYESLHTCGARFTGSYTTGDHAVIADDGEGTDFIFTNKGGALRIAMTVENGDLICSVTREAEKETFAAGIGAREGVTLKCGSSETFHNAAIAAGSIMGVTLSKGDVFSFNEIVGPRTETYGFISAPNGRGADVTGGGVAQAASAIWLAIKDMDDIAVLEKNAYGARYSQHYVENPADAILVDYTAGTDFRFKYTGEGCITICLWAEGDTITCKIIKE